MLRSSGLAVAAVTAISCVGGVAATKAAGSVGVDEARHADDRAVAAWTSTQARFAVIANGHAIEAATLDEAVVRATDMVPQASHIYLVDSRRSFVDAWEFSAPYGAHSVIGLDAMSAIVDKVALNPRAKEITLSKDGRSATIKYFEEVPVLRFLISPASNPSATKEVKLLYASGFSSGVFLRSEDAEGVRLERSEEPGRTDVSTTGFTGFGESVSCRRAVVWIELPELNSRALVHLVYPMKSVSE
jgi:hypothetical protein